MYEYEYDVIVVGAGNGGLCAATLCAKAGYKVLLLEKHNLPGGCATSFVRGRFEIEPSLHELCDKATSDKMPSMHQIYSDLGMDAPFLREDHLYRVVCKGPNGYDHRIRAGKQGFIDSMEEACPGCREQMETLFELNDLFDAAQIYMEECGGTTNMNPLVLLTKYGDFVRAAGNSTDALLDCLGLDDKAKSLTNTYWGYLGDPPRDLNAMHFISLLAAYAQEKPSMPYDRSHGMSLAMIKLFQQYGGEVWYNSPVTQFLYDRKGAAVGVMANGKEISAKKIISNVIPNNVMNLSDKRFVKKSMRKLANARKLGMSVTTVYLGLDATAKDLGIQDYSVFVMKDPDANKQYDLRKDMGIYIVNCLNTVLPDCSPEGTSMLFFTIPVFDGDFPTDLKPEEYKKYKNDVAEKYIRDYEELMGLDIMSHIEEISIATPVTFARYLSTPNGTIYGYMSQTWDNVVNRTVFKDLENQVENLKFCGGHSLRGDGYPSGFITGQIMANVTIAELKEGK
ncbi:MAG: NAD(P)/FAD-dependent oxidoreductase [Clostridia bacterium]|nr:NAD(P)/FAD-dependent oxidoreductase [Clostridia bacterium]